MAPQKQPNPSPSVDIPPNGRELQMVFWGVIERWHTSEDSIADWESALREIPLRHERDWGRMIEHLQLINTFQWHEEDRSHLDGISDPILAAVKRSIDASNSRRVHAVDALDDLIHSRLAAAGLLADGAPLHSESPGSIIDRLTVLALKIFHLREALHETGLFDPNDDQTGDDQTTDDQTPDERSRELHQRLRLLTEQHVDLTLCLDRLFDDIRAGKVGLKLYRQVKFYRDNTTGKPAG